MDQFVLLIFFVVFISFMMFISIVVYSNKQLLKELEDDQEDNTIKIKNIIDAVNYNDKKLFDNQKYLHQVYEENNDFVEISTQDNEMSSTSNNISTSKEQYYNMMKNYDALISLTK